MDPFTILATVLTNTAVLAGIAALWRWWSSRSTETRQHRQKREVDQEEHLQKAQGDALQTSLGLLEQLVQHLIATNNGRLGSIDESIKDVNLTLRPVLRALTDIKAKNEIVIRDWTRGNEILGDIDQMHHRIDDTTQRIEAKLTEA